MLCNLLVGGKGQVHRVQLVPAHVGDLVPGIGDQGLLGPLLGEHPGPDQLLRHHCAAKPQERRQEDQQEDVRRLQCGEILLECSFEKKNQGHDTILCWAQRLSLKSE